MGKEFFLFSAPVAIAIAGTAMAAPAFPIADHPLFKTAITAEKCFGHRMTLLDEIRLTTALRRDTQQDIHSWDVSDALSAARQTPSPSCSDANKEATLRSLQTALEPETKPQTASEVSQASGTATGAS